MGVNIVDFVKSIHMLQVSHLVSEAWEEIPQSTFRKSWQKILPTSGLAKTQMVAMANSYSGNDSEVANTLHFPFQEANAYDFLHTLKEVNEATRSTYSHAYRQSNRTCWVHVTIYFLRRQNGGFLCDKRRLLLSL